MVYVYTVECYVDVKPKMSNTKYVVLTYEIEAKIKIFLWLEDNASFV